MWRSLVAHLTGGQGVAGSNPVIPTEYERPLARVSTQVRGRFWFDDEIMDGAAMVRQAVSTDKAPRALGPYSQAIIANGFVFCSGTAGTDPATGIAPDGIEEQTELALRNLDAVLTAAGASLATLVKTTIFDANVDDVATINAVYARYMPDPPPARSAPANVRLPRNLLISIEAIAVLPAT
jgi:2-iminobutanoate/2-iminopropanoate deaminase